MKAHFNDPGVPSIANNIVSGSDLAVPPSNSTFGRYSDLVSLIQHSCAPAPGPCLVPGCCGWEMSSEYYYHHREHLLNFSEEEKSTRTARDIHGELPKGTKWKCPAEGCSCLFKREAELLRHINIHLSGVRSYECSELGCPYKGDKGFYRKDKLRDHQRNRHGLEIPRRHRAPRTPGGRISATPEQGFGQASGQAVENAVGQAFSYTSEQAPASASETTGHSSSLHA